MPLHAYEISYHCCCSWKKSHIMFAFDQIFMEWNEIIIKMWGHCWVLTLLLFFSLSQLCCLCFVPSVKYEDPQALGSLASALDVRQQNTGGVSTLMHVVWYCSAHPWVEGGCWAASVLSPWALPACDVLWASVFCSATQTSIQQKGRGLWRDYCYYLIAQINIFQCGNFSSCKRAFWVSPQKLI